MRDTKVNRSGTITRQTFLRRLGTVGVAATAMGGLAVFDAPAAFAAKPATSPKPTKPPATTSGFTQTIGGAGSPSRIAGSVAVAQDDPRVRFRGGAAVARGSWPYDVRGTGITPDWNQAHFEVEFVYDGRMLETYELAAGQWFAPIFDNNTIGAADKSMPNDWSLRYRLIDFGTKAVRRVRLQLNHYLGLRIEGGSTISPAQTPTGPRTIFLGDSFTEGTHGAYPSGSWHGGYAITAGLSVGLDAWPSGVGATGIVNDYGGQGGRVKFGDRLSSDVIRFAPEVVVIAGGINDRLLVADGVVTPSQYRSEYDLLIGTIRTNLPAAKVVVLGPFCPGTPSSYTGMTQIRDLNREAAQAAGLPFIDAFYFTDAMRKSYVSADGFHLNAAGHEYLGKKLGADLVAALS